MREAVFMEEIFMTVKGLENQDIYPGLRKVEEKVARKANLRRDQGRILWEAEVKS